MLTGLLPGAPRHPGEHLARPAAPPRRDAHEHLPDPTARPTSSPPTPGPLYERLPADSVAVTSPMAKGAAVDAKNTLAIVAVVPEVGLGVPRPQDARRRRRRLRGRPRGGAAPVPRPGRTSSAPTRSPTPTGRRAPSSVPRWRTSTRAFARLVRRLKRWRVQDRILFVLVGDHGNETYDNDGRRRGAGPPGPLRASDRGRLREGELRPRPAPRESGRRRTTSATPRSPSAPTAAS